MQEFANPERDPKPARRFPGIAAVWSAGRWQWRACITHERRQYTGPLRDSQAQAHADVVEVRRRAKRPRETSSVLGALSGVIQSAIDRGLEPHVVDGVWRRPAKSLLRYFRGEQPLAEVTHDQVRRYVLWCLDGSPEHGQPPVKPVTIRKEYLRVLAAAFAAAQLPSPIKAVLTELRTRMRGAPEPILGLEADEVAELLERIRRWGYRDPHDRRDTHLDWLLFALVATTGIRASELARVRRRDIDLERGLIAVAPKVRDRPRFEPVADELLQALRHHCAHLAGPDTPLVPGRGRMGPKDASWAAQGRYLNRMCMVWRRRLNEPRLNLRALRRAHGTAIDAGGAPFAVVRDALGHSRTSDETQRYLLARHKTVRAAKSRLATLLLGTAPEAAAEESSAEAPAQSDEPQPGT